MRNLRNLTALILATAAVACNQETPSSIPSITMRQCGVGGYYLSDISTETINSGQFAAQEFSVPAAPDGSGSLSLNTITLHMSTSGLTKVTMVIYDGDSSVTPDGGTQIAMNSVTAGLGNPSTNTPVVFSLLTVVPVGKKLWAVVSATGGSFNLSTNAQALFNAPFEIFDGAWNSPNANERASMAVAYWLPGCGE